MKSAKEEYRSKLDALLLRIGILENQLKLEEINLKNQ